MAVCGHPGGGADRRTARDPARPGRVQSDASQDRSQGRARHRPADAARLVSSGALQVAAGAGDTSAADSTQAAANQKSRRRDEPARRAPRLWAEGWSDDAANLPGRIRELVAGHPTLSTVAEALLAARRT